MKFFILTLLLLNFSANAGTCVLSEDEGFSEYYCLTKKMAKQWFPRGNRTYKGDTFLEGRGDHPELECKVTERVDLMGVEMCMRVKNLKYGGYHFAKCAAVDWLETAYTMIKDERIMMDLTGFLWRGFIIQEKRNKPEFSYIFRVEGKSFGCKNLKPTPAE